MPRVQIVPSMVNGVIGGVSYRVAPPDSVRKAVNFTFDDEIGSATTRLGMDILGGGRIVAEDNEVLGLYNFVDSEAGPHSRLIAAVNEPADGSASLYYLDGAAWTGGVANSTGLLAGAKVRFDTFLDSVVAVNGNSCRSWNGNPGSGWLVSGGPFDLDNMPVGSLVRVYKDQVIVAGVSGAPDTLYISSIPTGGAVSWTTNNREITVNPEDSSNITALGEIAGVLVVLKRFGFYTWNNRATEPDQLCGVGCSSQESVCVGGDMMFFFNEEGVWATKGSFPVLISDKVRPWIEGMSASNYENVAAHSDNRHLWVSIGDCTVDGIDYTNVVLRYSLKSKEWAVLSYSREFRNIVRYQSSGSVLAVAGDTTARVLQLDSGYDDDGDQIAYELETHDQDAGSPAIEKTINRLMYAFGDGFSGESVQVMENGGDWREIGHLNGEVAQMQANGVRGSRLRFRIAGVRASGRLTFRGFEIPELEPMGHAAR